MTHRLRFASWAAVSTKEQFEKVSIPDQLRINREHAEARGGEIVAELVVPGESRSIVLFEDACRQIQAYAQLRDMLAERSFDVLIFRDRTRLGRTVSLVTSVTELCREAGVALYDVESPPESLYASYSYDDQLIGAIKAVGAQREVAEIKRRHMHGMVGRIKKGRPPHGAFFGYKMVYDERGQYLRLEQVEPQASTVRRIFDLYLAGNGVDVIIETLANEGRYPAKAKSRRWHNASVYAVISNVWKYAGFTEVNLYKTNDPRKANKRQHVRAPGTWRPILTLEEAKQVEEERRQRKHNPYIAGAHSVLVGLCQCAECGRRMYIHLYQGRQQAHHYVRCERHRPSLSCRVELILQALAQYVDALPTNISSNENVEDHLVSYRSRIASLQESIKRDRASLVRLDNAFADGALDYERFMAQAERVTARLQESEAAILEVESEMSVAAQRGTLSERTEELRTMGKAMLASDDVGAANTFFRHRVEIVVASGRVKEIHQI